MARFRSNKRAKELQRKAKHEAKEVRKNERQERSRDRPGRPTSTGARRSASIHPPGWKPPARRVEDDDDDDGEDELEDDAEPSKSAS